MNYFRNRLAQRFAAIFVSAGLMLSLILPASAHSTLMSGQIVAQLFGRSIDVPVDDAFWDSWGSAQESSPSTLSDFVAEFIQAYELSNGVPLGTIGSDTHALWNVLMGISLNIDPLNTGAVLSSSWKSTSVTVTTLRSLTQSLDKDSLTDTVSSSEGLRNLTLPSTRSLLSSVNPQGP